MDRVGGIGSHAWSLHRPQVPSHLNMAAATVTDEVRLSLGWCVVAGSACEPVSEVEQVGQIQYALAEPRKGDVE